MGRSKALIRRPALPIVLAGVVGYLIGGWHPTALQSQVLQRQILRGRDLSAAQSVALRFPQQWEAVAAVAEDATVAPPAGVLDASTTTAPAIPADDAQLALLNPEPMVPPAVHPSAPQPIARAPAPEARVQLASAETVAMPPVASVAEPRRSRAVSAPTMPAVAPVVPVAPPRINRVSAAPRRAVMNRPGFMLDDAQIASIKVRLHLTPDQEQMWPSVEAALRNIAYTHAQQARRRSTSGEATAAADIDPQSVEGLKSAAVPLIMSFNEEQKQQVRDLAHVMGLDQLASEF
jgi:hypothetical protein